MSASTLSPRPRVRSHDEMEDMKQLLMQMVESNRLMREQMELLKQQTAPAPAAAPAPAPAPTKKRRTLYQKLSTHFLMGWFGRSRHTPTVDPDSVDDGHAFTQAFTLGFALGGTVAETIPLVVNHFWEDRTRAAAPIRMLCFVIESLQAMLFLIMWNAAVEWLARFGLANSLMFKDSVARETVVVAFVFLLLVNAWSTLVGLWILKLLDVRNLIWLVPLSTFGILTKRTDMFFVDGPWHVPAVLLGYFAVSIEAVIPPRHVWPRLVFLASLLNALVFSDILYTAYLNTASPLGAPHVDFLSLRTGETILGNVGWRFPPPEFAFEQVGKTWTAKKSDSVRDIVNRLVVEQMDHIDGRKKSRSALNEDLDEWI